MRHSANARAHAASRLGRVRAKATMVVRLRALELVSWKNAIGTGAQFWRRAAGRRRAFTVPANCNNSFQKLPDIRIVLTSTSLSASTELGPLFGTSAIRGEGLTGLRDRSRRWLMATGVEVG